MLCGWIYYRSNNMSLDKDINHSFKKARLIERLLTYHDLRSDMDKLISQIEKEIVKLDKEHAKKGEQYVSKGTKT
jgi:hypothetical protein